MRDVRKHCVFMVATAAATARPLRGHCAATARPLCWPAPPLFFSPRLPPFNLQIAAFSLVFPRPLLHIARSTTPRHRFQAFQDAKACHLHNPFDLSAPELPPGTPPELPRWLPENMKGVVRNSYTWWRSFWLSSKPELEGSAGELTPKAEFES